MDNELVHFAHDFAVVGLSLEPVNLSTLAGFSEEDNSISL
jgi:hypothetical protein